MGIVVPLVGTWIETATLRSASSSVIVVPLVGTWIETAITSYARNFTIVVPLVGTWIETVNPHINCKGKRCRSPRGNVD